MLVLYGLIYFVLLFGKELWLSSIYHSQRSQERLAKRVILVGGNESDLAGLRQRLQQMGAGWCTQSRN